jgi:hypothetical protein
MQYAMVEGARREVRQSRERGTCPGCGADVVGKAVGSAWVSPHWSHLRGADCDAWHEPETAWHRAWKRDISGGDVAREEVTIREGAVWHRADVVDLHGHVLELQHSGISASEMREREDFYSRATGGMLWILDHTGRDPVAPGRDHRVHDARAVVLLDYGDVVVATWRGRTFARWSREDLLDELLGGGVGRIVAYRMIWEEQQLEAEEEARRDRLRREQEERDRWEREMDDLVSSIVVEPPRRPAPLPPRPVVVEEELPPLTDAELDEMIGVACRDTAVKHRSWELWDQARSYIPGLPERPPWVRAVLDAAEVDELLGG